MGEGERGKEIPGGDSCKRWQGGDLTLMVVTCDGGTRWKWNVRWQRKNVRWEVIEGYGNGRHYGGQWCKERWQRETLWKATLLGEMGETVTGDIVAGNSTGRNDRGCCTQWDVVGGVIAGAMLHLEMVGDVDRRHSKMTHSKGGLCKVKLCRVRCCVFKKTQWLYDWCFGLECPQVNAFNPDIWANVQKCRQNTGGDKNYCC